MQSRDVTDAVRVGRRGDEIYFEWRSGDVCGEGPYFTVEEALNLARDLLELAEGK